MTKQIMFIGIICLIKGVLEYAVKNVYDNFNKRSKVVNAPSSSSSNGVKVGPKKILSAANVKMKKKRIKRKRE